MNSFHWAEAEGEVYEFHDGGTIVVTQVVGYADSQAEAERQIIEFEARSAEAEAERQAC